MNRNGADIRQRRRGHAEVASVVKAYEQSGLTRKEFSTAHGIKIHTLDAWRRRVTRNRSSVSDEIVPVELVSSRVSASRLASARSASPGVALRVILPSGLRVEVETGFDAVELRRLLSVLEESPRQKLWVE